ncbi:MAG: leucine-rich repeat domain-containing protein, partial [Clostridia bacterium]|nr:leucine-rich repeat domain-containing protein [Clostridia bacterium]
PSSLTKVMNYAFDGCTSLKAIELPDSVTSIGSGAFRGCASLTSFRYPKGWAAEQATSTKIFVGCTKLERVIIPEGVTRVVRHAFRGCEGLREVQCPTTLESIDSYAFAECLNLTTVVLPEGLKTVESNAFSGCVSLKVIDLPNSVETIEGVAFANCTSLETVHLPTQWKTSGYKIFANCTKLKTVVVPQGLTKLPNDAFIGCSGIEEVYLPSSLLEIGEYAFSGCTGLKDVHFQEGLRKINACAFRSCTSLKDADLPDSVEHILDCIFENCTSLETFRYPLNWYNTFVSSSWPYHIYSGYHVRGCTKLTKIIVPEGVTTLPHFIMCGCDNIEEVVLPDSLLEIQDGAFSDCANLRKANIPGSVVYIGKDVFANCPLLNISCEWETKGYHYAADNNFAHEYLTLHSAEYPRGKLPMGEAFAFGGELHASEQIHSLSAHVYNADGSRLLQGSIATPYDTAADLGDCFTSAFHIEDLPEGRYLFRMKAVVNGSPEKVLAETIFDIVSSSGDCETDGLVLPEGTLRQGYAFPFGGKVILDLEGGTLSGSLSIAIVEEIENQNVRSCILAPDLLGEIDLKNAQEKLAFATLEPGIYTCRLTATLGYDRFLVTETHFRISPQSEDIQRAQKLDAALLGLSSSRSSDLLYESAILSNRAYDVNQAISNL